MQIRTCTRTGAHIDGITAHTAAPYRTPTKRISAPRNAPPAKTAHTSHMSTTRAVFHAPMFALNADAEPNACGPTLRGPRQCEDFVS